MQIIRTGFSLIWLHEVESKLNRMAAVLVTGGSLSATSPVTAVVRHDDTVVCETLTQPADGAVTFYGVMPKVRDYMLSNGLSVGYFWADFVQGGGTVPGDTLDVLFCEWRLGNPAYVADEFSRNRFLTASAVTMQAVPRLELYLYAHPDMQDAAESSYPMEVEVTQHLTDGTTRTSAVEVAAGDRLSSGVFRIEKNLLAKTYRVEAVCGNRMQTVYLYRADGRSFQFLFRNLFNADELVNIPAHVTLRPETESDEGVFDDTRERYGVTHEEAYTLESDRVPPEMYDTLRALVLSRDARYINDPVIIDGYELERLTGAGGCLHFRMDFRLKDKRKIIENR